MDCTERFLEILDELKNRNIIRSYQGLHQHVPSLYTQKITNMRYKKSKITVEVLNEFLTAFPYINANYLFRETNMFMDEPEEEPKDKKPSLEEMILEERERSRIKDEQIMKLVNMVTQK